MTNVKNNIKKNNQIEAKFDPQSLITLAPINTDQIVGDMCSRSIDLPITLAKYLYRGKVYAIDINKEFNNLSKVFVYSNSGEGVLINKEYTKGLLLRGYLSDDYN